MQGAAGVPPTGASLPGAFLATPAVLCMLRPKKATAMFRKHHQTTDQMPTVDWARYEAERHAEQMRRERIRRETVTRRRQLRDDIRTAEQTLSAQLRLRTFNRAFTAELCDMLGDLYEQEIREDEAARPQQPRIPRPREAS